MSELKKYMPEHSKTPIDYEEKYEEVVRHKINLQKQVEELTQKLELSRKIPKSIVPETRTA